MSDTVAASREKLGTAVAVVGEKMNPDVALSAMAKIGAGAPIEDVIQYMRRSGFDVMDCILVLADTERYSLGQAKLTVYNSATWSDVRDEHDSFHEGLIRELASEEQG